MSKSSAATHPDDLRPLVGAIEQTLARIAWLLEHRARNESDPAWTEVDRIALDSFAATNAAAINYLCSKIDQLQDGGAATDRTPRDLH